MRAEVAIVGNGVAGTACAMRLAREGIRPLLIGPGLPVDRPPLTKSALADGVPRLLSDAARLAERGIDLLDGMVASVDLAACMLTVATEEGETSVAAERVVLTTGLAYRPPPIPGLDGAFVNANPHVFDALGRLLTSGPVEIIVVGAGLIGTESAATLAQAGHSVTLVDLLDRPLDRLHAPLPDLGRETLDELGVQFHGGVAIESATEYSLETAAHGTLEADVILAATGGVPFAPPGLAIDPEHLPLAVAADMLVPGYERAYACGDLVLVPHARFGAMRFPHWDAAIGTGEHVADSIAGNGGPYERLPYWWSDIGPRRLAEVGFAEAASTWAEEDGLHVGRNTSGEPVCVLVVDAPRRLREARAIVQDGA
ncbi:NAD(P)/FAD-dependent oxidoreductase [Gaiella sp.]|uniref:NAD(P)/FAD-dependent oxidoreductase n=1 Tax=Gaiella sp. TaxID=2663207 RepID=UPI00326420D0